MGYALKQSKLDFLRLANPALRIAFAQGMAMFQIQDLAASAVGVLAAKAGNSAISSWSTGITNPAHIRSLQVVFAGSYDGGNITITGLDQFGRAQTETITANAGNTVQGTKVWKTISTIAKAAVGGNAATFTVQTGTDHLGLPVPLLGTWGMGLADGVAELMTFNATVHSFKPATTPDSSVDFTILMPVDWAKHHRMIVTEVRDISASPSPSASPSASPSVSPSASPSLSPSASPSMSPSISLSKSPSISPSASPSISPSISPSLSPSISPSGSPSISPSESPSLSTSPSISPSESPSISPSESPSVSPSESPSISPSLSPSESPSLSTSPSISPSESPSESPSVSPSV